MRDVLCICIDEVQLAGMLYDNTISIMCAGGCKISMHIFGYGCMISRWSRNISVTCGQCLCVYSATGLLVNCAVGVCWLCVLFGLGWMYIMNMNCFQ